MPAISVALWKNGPLCFRTKHPKGSHPVPSDRRSQRLASGRRNCGESTLGEVEELLDEVAGVERLAADHAGNVLVLLALPGGPEASQELACLGASEPVFPIGVLQVTPEHRFRNPSPQVVGGVVAGIHRSEERRV